MQIGLNLLERSIYRLLQRNAVYNSPQHRTTFQRAIDLASQTRVWASQVLLSHRCFPLCRVTREAIYAHRSKREQRRSLQGYVGDAMTSKAASLLRHRFQLAVDVLLLVHGGGLEQQGLTMSAALKLCLWRPSASPQTRRRNEREMAVSPPLMCRLRPARSSGILTAAAARCRYPLHLSTQRGPALGLISSARGNAIWQRPTDRRRGAEVAAPLEVIRVPREPRRQKEVRTKRAVKPESLTYGADDVPPLRDVVLGGVQQSLLIIVSLIVPLVIGREAHLSPDDLQRYLTLALVAIAIGNLLIPFRVGPIGCGYLVPVFFAGLWLAPALVAVKAGGIPLVAGMTLVAGAATIPTAWLLPRLRPYLPAEISGLVVLIIGLNVSLIGLRRALQPIIAGADPRDVLWTAGSTLGLAVALRVWGTRSLSSYAIVISMVVGSVIGVATGLTPPNVLDAIARAPTVALPDLRPFGVAFDPALALPFLVTALAAVISMAGAVTNAQKINDVAWIRPDMLAIRGATIGQGIGMMIVGLLGGFGLASSSAAVGLTGATGNASRRVALAVSAILALAALSPLLVDVVIAIPDGVIGATWLLLGGFIIIGALEMVTSRLLDARRSIVIGLALPIGLIFSAELFPDFYASLPQVVKPIAGSMLALGTMTALVLNAIFRIGIRRQARLVVDASGFDPTAVAAFLARQGGIWAARREIVSRATFALVQLLELIRDHRSPRGNIDVLATFDEFNLRIEATYDGAQAELPTRRPSPREMVADDTAVERLAGFLVRQSADAVNISHDGGRTRVRLVFEH